MAIFGRKKTFLSEGKRFLGIMLYEEALRQLNQSIERRENLNEAYFYCAAASFLKTDMSAAKKFLGMLIDLNPDPKTIKMICDLTGMKKLVSNKYRNALPCFSRDGKRIVFASSRKKIENSIVNNNTGIYIVDVDTGEEFQVVKDEFNNYMPFFSPDGNKIVFLSRRRDTNNDGMINNLDNPGIYVIDTDGKNEKCIVSDKYFNKHPSFSPDGMHVVFTSWRGSNSGIYIMNSNGTDEKQIVTDAYDNTFPSFSPTGQYIIYTSWRRDTNKDGRIDFRDNSGIYITDVNMKNEKLCVSDRHNNSFPRFSPDGTRILYLCTTRDTNHDGRIDSLDNNNIFISDLNGKNIKCVSSDKYYNKMPTFSYDGRKIAFLSGVDDSNDMSKAFFSPKGIYMAEANGKNRVQLLSDKFWGSSFVLFSPVENKLLYMCFRKGTNRGINIMDIGRTPSLEEVKEFINNLD